MTQQTELGTQQLHGWGYYPLVEGREIVSEDLESTTRGSTLTRGLGRSYGDASLPPEGGTVASSRLADRVLHFDDGVLTAEAGISLARLNQLLLPRGWFTPVTPGTQQVTLGGMIAADVHGKNHHAAGTFGKHVLSMRMRVADGRVLEISRESEPDLFRATLGGLGLTGHVLSARVKFERIASPWIFSESAYATDLDALLQMLLESSSKWPYTVAWSDFFASGAAFGRGTVAGGRWAEPGEAPSSPPELTGAFDVPWMFPNWFLSSWNIKAFNAARTIAHGRERRLEVISPIPFFYPLDVIGNWPRFYGRRGFTQYQCVVPVDGVGRFIDRLKRARTKPFLVVIKDFGDEGEGTLSFPKRGMTFALDFPIDDGTQALVDDLNEVVAADGGRIYLAKDAFTRREHYLAMDPRVPLFNEVRETWDPNRTLRSALSARILDRE